MASATGIRQIISDSGREHLYAGDGFIEAWSSSFRLDVDKYEVWSNYRGLTPQSLEEGKTSCLTKTL
jgi:hypothetical protein